MEMVTMTMTMMDDVRVKGKEVTAEAEEAMWGHGGANSLLEATEGVVGDDVGGEGEGVLEKYGMEGGGAIGEVEAAGLGAGRAGEVGDL
ncbi:hypothetical protein COCNU_08G010620 [Cocos nucifera]|uniref:Uncharacterized protein n=1 Tax=Cocos nucifera TaxID=13894 RepID=A0A8K0IK22_COCNU|nr:hypothetical protein COCNU_08G010620 [Cocos nucifera]